MRLWSLHPKYLDTRGLVALWREGLLAQKVLKGQTKGYKHHPQLERFKALRNPEAGIAIYLMQVRAEAERRGYNFDATKIPRLRSRAALKVTRGQLHYELEHLLAKLKTRDPERYKDMKSMQAPDPHPCFKVTPGGVASWEKT